MSWTEIAGHAGPITRLRSALAAGRLHPALLFEGPEGVGKKRVALTLARALHCPQAPAREGDPCGTCRVCLAILRSGDPELTQENQSAHPGVRVVSQSRPDEREIAHGGTTARGEVRSQIAVAQVRLVLAEGSRRRSATSSRVVIIDPADMMGDPAANALLKTLEEPRRGEHFVLVTSRPSALLPTVRSRCVRVRFAPLSQDGVLRAIAAARGGKATGPRQPGAGADRLVAALSGGRVGRALALLDPSSLETFLAERDLLLRHLERLAAGRPAASFAIVASASLGTREREGWLEALATLEVLLRDLAVLAASPGAAPVNVDLRDRLEPLVPSIGPRAARALRALDSVRRDFRFNVNGRLALERVLLAVAGHTMGAHPRTIEPAAGEAQ